MNRLTALVPIKANSERVPGKNFRAFAGRPLFQWILDTLREVDEVDQIVINTDASEMLRAHGLPGDDRVRVRERDPELRGDTVSMNRIIADDIAHAESELYLMTHVTNPLLRAETIRSALHRYHAAKRDEGRDSLFTVNRVQARFYRADVSPVNHDPNNLVRTQDLEPWFEENSNLYLFTADSFGRTGARIGETPALFPSPYMESVDIDDPTGWHLAEIIALSRFIGESTRRYEES